MSKKQQKTAAKKPTMAKRQNPKKAKPLTAANIIAVLHESALREVNAQLYGFYCAGYARGAQQTTMASVVTVANAKTPQEMWAFAFGFRGGRDKHDLLGLSVLLMKCDEYFTRPAARML